MEALGGTMVSNLIAFAAVVVSILTALISVGAASYIAIKYGDVRAARELMDFEEKKSAKAQRFALLMLSAETKRIMSLARYNAEIGNAARGALRVPVGTFERAFLSAQSALVGGDADSVIESSCFPLAMVFLTEAHAINELIANPPAPPSIGIADNTPERIAEKSQALECSLANLATALEEARAAARAKEAT